MQNLDLFYFYELSGSNFYYIVKTYKFILSIFMWLDNWTEQRRCLTRNLTVIHNTFHKFYVEKLLHVMQM